MEASPAANCAGGVLGRSGWSRRSLLKRVCPQLTSLAVLHLRGGGITPLPRLRSALAPPVARRSFPRPPGLHSTAADHGLWLQAKMAAAGLGHHRTMTGESARPLLSPADPPLNDTSVSGFGAAGRPAQGQGTRLADAWVSSTPPGAGMGQGGHHLLLPPSPCVGHTRGGVGPRPLTRGSHTKGASPRGAVCSFGCISVSGNTEHRRV